MEGMHSRESNTSTLEVKNNNNETNVLRGSKRWFNRLVGATVLGVAALSPVTEANAGGLDVFGKQVAAGVFNQMGSPYGVTVGPSYSGNGQPEVHFDPNQAARAMEQRRQQQVKQQQQQAFEQTMQRPTQVSFDDSAKQAFEQRGLTVTESGSSFIVFHPSNFEGKLFLNGQTAKYTAINFRQPAENIFLVALSYVLKSNGQTGSDTIAVRFDPLKKTLTQIKM
jgi:hypothetical protein